MPQTGTLDASKRGGRQIGSPVRIGADRSLRSAPKLTSSPVAPPSESTQSKLYGSRFVAPNRRIRNSSNAGLASSSRKIAAGASGWDELQTYPCPSRRHGLPRPIDRNRRD